MRALVTHLRFKSTEKVKFETSGPYIAITSNKPEGFNINLFLTAVVSSTTVATPLKRCEINMVIRKKNVLKILKV